MKTNRPVLNSDETFLSKHLDDIDSEKDLESDIIPATDPNFTEQWNNVKTRWHRNYGCLFSANDSTQSSNPEKTFQNQLYLSEERDLFDDRSQAPVITKERAFKRRRRYVCVGVTIAIVLVLLACIISAVLVEVTFAPPRKDLAVQARLSMRIINRNYTEELSNKSSESFQLFQKEFCSAVLRKVNEDMSCIVDAVNNGSLIADIILFTTSTTNAEAFGASVIAILKGGRLNETIYWIGVFQLSEIKLESSNIIVQDTNPPTAIIYNKDENASPSTTEITTSIVTSLSSIHPSPVETSNETSTFALLQELRSTDISPRLLESRSSESSVRPSVETSSKILESGSNVESLTEISSTLSKSISDETSISSNGESSTMLESSSTRGPPMILESSPKEAFFNTNEMPSTMIESLIVSESYVNTLLPSFYGSSSTSNAPVSSSPQPELYETSSITFKSRYTASATEFGSSEPTFGIPQSRSTEELKSSTADDSSIMLAFSSSSSKESSTMLEPTYSDTTAPMFESRSSQASDSSLQSRSTVISSSTKTSFSTQQPNSNDELSTILESNSAQISSIMLKPGSIEISSSALQPSSNEALSTMLDSRSADTNEYSFSTRESNSNEELSSILKSSSTLISSIMLGPGSGEVTSSSLQPSSNEALDTMLDSSSSEFSFSTLQSNSNEDLSSILESGFTLISSIMLEPSPSEITSSTLQPSSNEALATMLDSRSADVNPSSEISYSSLQARSTEALSDILLSSYAETSSITLETSSQETSKNTPHTSTTLQISSIEISFRTPQSRSNEALSSMLKSSSTLLSSIMLEPSSGEITSSALQLSSINALEKMLDSRSSETSYSSLQAHSSEITFSALQPSSNEALPTILDSRSADLNPSSEIYYSSLQARSAEALSGILLFSSAEISSTSLRETSTNTPHTSSTLQISSNEIPFSTPQSRSNKALSTLESITALTSSMTLEPGSSEITSSALPPSSSTRETSISIPKSSLNLETSPIDISISTSQSSSNEAVSTMLKSITAEVFFSTLQPKSIEATSSLFESSSSNTLSIMLESRSSVAPFSDLESSSNEATSSMLESSSVDIFSKDWEHSSWETSYISLHIRSTEVSSRILVSISKVETSSTEYSFSAPEGNSSSTAFFLSTPQLSLNEVLSTVESSSAVNSPIILESSSWVINSRTTQLGSIMLESSSGEVSYGIPPTRSIDESPCILVSSFSETPSNWFIFSSIDSFTSSLQTSSTEKMSDDLTSIFDGIVFGVSGTYYSALESMSNTALSNTQLPISSLSPYVLQPSSTEISPTEVTSGTSPEALTKSLESDFIEVSSSTLPPLSSMLVPSSVKLTSSITEPGSTNMLISTTEIKPSAFATESSITTVELASSMVTTTFEIQRSESSENVMATTEIPSVTSTSESPLTPSPSLIPSSTQDIEMSSTLIPVITVRDTLIYQNEDNLTLECNITNTENFTQIIVDVNGVEAGKITSDLIQIEPQWTFRNESNSDKQIYLMTLEEANCTHSGNYTCSIGGDWGVVQQTATIEVRVAQEGPVVMFPDQIVEDQSLSQRITCSVDTGIPVSVVTWSVEFQDSRKLENFNFNPTEETNSLESCTNNHVSSFISTFNISWHNSNLCCNVDQGSRKTSSCKHLFVVPSDYCNNRTDRLYDHPYDDCYLFVSCGHGRAYISSCPKGGVYCFDEQSQSCSRALPTTTMDPSQASDPYSCFGKGNAAYIPVRGSCKDYIWCVNGVRYEYVCAGSTYFFDTDPNHVCTNDINQAYCTLHDNT